VCGEPRLHSTDVFTQRQKSPWVFWTGVQNVRAASRCGGRRAGDRRQRRTGRVGERRARELGEARDTPEDQVVAALIDKGLSEVEAKAMVSWLDDDAVILLPK